MKCILFSTLIVIVILNQVVHYSMCDTIYIIPTPEGPCPGQPCFTLQQYAANPSHSSNITLNLYAGNHQMGHAQLSISNVSSFTVRAAKPDSVMIMCDQKHPPGNSLWFMFTEVPTVNISDITFNGCKIPLVIGETDIVVNAEFIRNSFVNNTCSTDDPVLSIIVSTSVTTAEIEIKQCIFADNCLGKNATIYSYGNNLTVDQSIFKNNFVNSSDPDRGGALYYYSSLGYLNIVNSNFSNNEIASNMVELLSSIVEGKQR